MLLLCKNVFVCALVLGRRVAASALPPEDWTVRGNNPHSVSAYYMPGVVPMMLLYWALQRPLGQGDRYIHFTDEDTALRAIQQPESRRLRGGSPVSQT